MEPGLTTMLKKRILVNLLIIVMAFSFTSCINIIEKVLFKKDGSGTYSMTVDMSEIAAMMSMFSENDEKDGMDDALKGMNEEFEKTKARLSDITGVSNVRQEANKEELTYTMAFDFKDLSALNDGLNGFFVNQQDETEHTFFTQKKKTYTRTAYNRLTQALSEGMNAEGAQDMDLGALFGDAYYETIIEFERSIKSHSNKDYRLDGNHKLSWKQALFSKDNAQKTIEVTVKVK